MVLGGLTVNQFIYLAIDMKLFTAEVSRQELFTTKTAARTTNRTHSVPQDNPPHGDSLQMCSSEKILNRKQFTIQKFTSDKFTKGQFA
jgi:hypothetical protein